MGELENTYVIYTADHGIAVGRHGLMGKQNLYEHSESSPYSKRAKDQAGFSCTSCISLDLLPTL